MGDPDGHAFGGQDPEMAGMPASDPVDDANAAFRMKKHRADAEFEIATKFRHDEWDVERASIHAEIEKLRMTRQAEAKARYKADIADPEKKWRDARRKAWDDWREEILRLTGKLPDWREENR
jgi:hypothetical protein